MVEQRERALELVREDLSQASASCAAARAVLAAGSIDACRESVQYAAARLRAAESRLEGVTSNTNHIPGSSTLPGV